MKKIVMLVALVLATVSASAQVYIGGALGVNTTEVKGGSETTTWRFIPEIGYELNENWDMGIGFGFEKGTASFKGISVADAKTWTVSPYVRYTYLKSEYVNLFVEGGFGFETSKGSVEDFDATVNSWSVGVKPGISVNLGKNFSFVTKVGFLGWNQSKVKDSDYKVTNFGLNLDGENLSFGFCYHF